MGLAGYDRLWNALARHLACLKQWAYRTPPKLLCLMKVTLHVTPLQRYPYWKPDRFGWPYIGSSFQSVVCLFLRFTVQKMTGRVLLPARHRFGGSPLVPLRFQSCSRRPKLARSFRGSSTFHDWDRSTIAHLSCLLRSHRKSCCSGFVAGDMLHVGLFVVAEVVPLSHNRALCSRAATSIQDPTAKYVFWL